LGLEILTLTLQAAFCPLL